MRLHNLKPRPGAKHRRKRLGQGESSGHGKTSGRGGKGQTARSGSSIRIGFEGGQMPLIRRIPKRGFNNARHAITYIPVNLESLNSFADNAKVDVAALQQAGLANGPGTNARIKILGSGELTKKLSVTAHAFSASAKAKIEKLGGSCEIISAPAPVAKA
ncbi:MAG TPA: 50S ribosomal protein L15 [Dongiaceae bacterium]|nr:50S ribosomal protein L15 [Dongiaceae bacterium]